MASSPGPGTSRNRSGHPWNSDQQGGYVGIDLNEMPLDLNEEAGVIPPNYFMGLLSEVIGESAQPAVDASYPAMNVDATVPTTETGTFINVSNTTTVAHGSDDDEVSSQPNDPHIGMRFDTLLEAKEFYNAYALRKGFSTKQNTSRRSVYTGELDKQQFACNKSRKPKEDDGGAEIQFVVGPIPDPVELDEIELEAAEIASVIAELGPQSPKKKGAKKRKRESIIQTGCKAKMVVKLRDGRYEVISFVAEHNHPLVWKPSLSKYLRSHQGIPPEERDFVKNLYNTNLAAGRMMTIMSEFYGTELLVPYTTKTITNFCATLGTEKVDGDLKQVVEYFKELQTRDPEFFFSVLQDDEERVVNIFWVDSAARKAYAEAYHDCISFDATYLTNMYNMPFAPFIGINRHGQSIMLGCGFVSQELATSYDWLFSNFLEAMRGLQPLNIITDQDIAMKVSIGRIFPNTVHRNCRWHIMAKAQVKCGPVLHRNPGLAEDFNACVDFSFSPQEFEAKWALFVGKWPEAATHSYFSALYENRKYWIPCYFKHRFFPFLQSTQRSEGFNAVLKRYVNPHKSVLNFVRQYEKIQTHILVREGGNDYRTDFLGLEPWSPYPIEQQALEVYTRDIYLRFRNEFELIGRYNVQPFGGNYFKLEPNRGWCAKYGTRTYLVAANKEEGMYSCECSKMDRDGILCCHILKIFTHLGVDVIPERYILKRWTQNAVSGTAATLPEQQPDEMPPEAQREIRHANLNMNFSKVARLGSASDAAAAILNKHIRAAATEISQLNKSRKKKNKTPAVPSTSAPNDPPTPRDPPKSTTKGRTKAHRTKSALELHPKQKTKCSMCGSFLHNAATCTLRLL